MREIKFRGKSKKDGKWLYGDLLRNVDGDFAVVQPFGIHLNNYCEPYEVDPDTIGQFTGLKDKNGREIYEGDIIRFFESESYVINPDCDPWLHIHSVYVKEHISQVEYIGSQFIAYLNGDIEIALDFVGFDSIEQLRDVLNLKEEDKCDSLGTEINDSLVGIEVIGNIFDSKFSEYD